MPAAAAAFTKNLWLTCNRMPTPSPVFPSASLPARCSRCSTICSASSSVRWLLRPLISTTAPMPQLSCSNRESYNPAGAVRSVKFSIAFSPLGLLGYVPEKKKRRFRLQGILHPSGNAIVLCAYHTTVGTALQGRRNSVFFQYLCSICPNSAKSGGSAHQSSQAYKTAAPGEGSCRLRKFLRFLISGINLYNVHL